MAERLPEAGDARPDDRSLAACPGGRRRRLGDPAQHGDREDGPPYGHAEERQPGSGYLAEHEDHGGVDRQQDPPSHVPDGVAQGRDPVLVLGSGDVRKESVVEHVGGPEADPSEHEQQRRQHPIAGSDQDQQSGGDDAGADRYRQQGFLPASQIGDRSQERGEDGHHEERHAEADRPVGGGHRLGGQRLPGDSAVVDREDGGEDGGRKGRVGPVVHRPGSNPPSVLGVADTVVARQRHRSPSPSPARLEAGNLLRCRRYAPIVASEDHRKRR